MQGQRADESSVARCGMHRYDYQQHFQSNVLIQVEQWSIEDVVKWITNIPGVELANFAALSQIFKHEEIHGGQLLLLQEINLKDMGITKTGVRLAILSAIESRTLILLRLR